MASLPPPGSQPPQPSCHILGTRNPGRHFSHWEAYPHFTDRKLRLSGNKLLGPVGPEGTDDCRPFLQPRALSGVVFGDLNWEYQQGFLTLGVDVFPGLWWYAGPLGAQAADSACWWPWLHLAKGTVPLASWIVARLLSSGRQGDHS